MRRTVALEGAIRSAERLDERHLVDFLQGGKPAPHFIERRLAQEAHTLFASGAPDLRSRLLRQNHLADPVRQIQQFVNGCPATETSAGALDAALTFVQRHLRPDHAARWSAGREQTSILFSR